VTNWAQAERQVAVEALRDLGPDAPTACEGWSSKHMAAHLYVRERRPDAGPGVILPGPFASHTDRVMASVLRVHGYEDLVAKIAVGPPLLLRPFDGVMNLFEFFAHAEDIRRPNGGAPRELPAEQVQLMWRRLRASLRVMLRRASGIRIDVVAADGDRTTVGDGPAVELRGPVGELVLYSYGRKGIANVTVTGDTKACDLLAQAHLGP
jgi:uncharacterized protein (TIGR03085 family)